MKDNQVFSETAEIERLNTQKRLFSPYEHVLYEEVLQGKSLRVLDIGCNNGDKTVEKFDAPNVQCVIGFEYHKVLADSAQSAYGGDKFSFYPCNVESEDFLAFLQSVMQVHGINKFDIINLSLVLSHLTDPRKLLRILKPFLSRNGRLVILESDDSAVSLAPDGENLLPKVMHCVAVDAFAGDRTLAAKLPDLLQQTGYHGIEVIEVNIAAKGRDLNKKKAIYDVFFSYLQSDMEALLKEDPQNAEYHACLQWLAENKAQIKAAICERSEKVSLGIKLFVAHGGEQV